MGILNKLFTRSDTPAPSPEVLPPLRLTEGAAYALNEERALSIIEVYRSAQLLSSDAASLSIDCFRGSKKVSAPLWIQLPDIKLQSQGQFIEQTVLSLALRGNAYWRIIRDTPADKPTAIIVLDPLDCYMSKDGLTLTYNGREYANWQFVQLKLFARPGHTYGLGPIQAASPKLAAALEDERYRDSFRKTSGVPSGILSTDTQLTPEQASQMKNIWDSATAGETRILGYGLNYQNVLLTPQEVEYIAGAKLTAQSIARLFGIPSHLLNVENSSSSLTYQNIQDAETVFIRHTLSTYLRVIEDAFSFLLPRGTVAKFNLEGVLRSSTSQRYASYATAISSGFLTVDEVREIEGREPLPEEKPKPEPTEEEDSENE